MSHDLAVAHQNDEAIRYEISDEELEAAAGEGGRTYTHQTSAYNRCCR